MSYCSSDKTSKSGSRNCKGGRMYSGKPGRNESRIPQSREKNLSYAQLITLFQLE